MILCLAVKDGLYIVGSAVLLDLMPQVVVFESHTLTSHYMQYITMTSLTPGSRDHRDHTQRSKVS